jgi:hypothetical protein
MLPAAKKRLGVAVIIVVVLAIAVTYWYRKDTVKFSITGIVPATSGGGLAISGSTTSTSDPSLWVGKKLYISTKSLGRIRTTVASSSASMITTAPVTLAGTYAPDSKDSARIILKL